MAEKEDQSSQPNPQPRLDQGVTFKCEQLTIGTIGQIGHNVGSGSSGGQQSGSKHQSKEFNPKDQKKVEAVINGHLDKVAPDLQQFFRVNALFIACFRKYAKDSNTEQSLKMTSLPPNEKVEALVSYVKQDPIPNLTALLKASVKAQLPRVVLEFDIPEIKQMLGFTQEDDRLFVCIKRQLDAEEEDD